MMLYTLLYIRIYKSEAEVQVLLSRALSKRDAKFMPVIGTLYDVRVRIIIFYQCSSYSRVTSPG